MVKIVIMEWEDFSRMVYKEIKEGLKKGSFAKQGDVIYAESLEAALRLLSPEKKRLLDAVKDTKPSSLYALAKTMKKDFKTVFTDAKYLSNAGLLTLENRRIGARQRLRPVFHGNKISVELTVGSA